MENKFRVKISNKKGLLFYNEFDDVELAEEYYFKVTENINEFIIVEINFELKCYKYKMIRVAWERYKK